MLGVGAGDEESATRAPASERHHGLQGSPLRRDSPARIGRFLLGAGLMLVALNLRPLTDRDMADLDRASDRPAGPPTHEDMVSAPRRHLMATGTLPPPPGA